MDIDAINSKKHYLDRRSGTCVFLEKDVKVVLHAETDNISLKRSTNILQESLLKKTSEIDNRKTSTTEESTFDGCFLPLTQSSLFKNDKIELDDTYSIFINDVSHASKNATATSDISGKVQEAINAYTVDTGTPVGMPFSAGDGGSGRGREDRRCSCNSDRNACRCLFFEGGVKSDAAEGVVFSSEADDKSVSRKPFYLAMRYGSNKSVFSSEDLCERSGLDSLHHTPTSHDCENCCSRCGCFFQGSLDFFSTKHAKCLASTSFLKILNPTHLMSSGRSTKERHPQSKLSLLPPHVPVFVQQSELKNDFCGENEQTGVFHNQDVELESIEAFVDSPRALPQSAIKTSENELKSVAVEVCVDDCPGDCSKASATLVRKRVCDSFAEDCKELAHPQLSYVDSKNQSCKILSFSRSATFSVMSDFPCASPPQPVHQCAISVDKRNTNGGYNFIPASGKALNNSALTNYEDLGGEGHRESTLQRYLFSRKASAVVPGQAFRLQDESNCCCESTFAEACCSKVHQGNGLYEANYVTFLGNADGRSPFPYVSVGFDEAGTQKGDNRTSIPDKQWLGVPILFYLVLNLIKLHEIQEFKKNGFDDSFSDASRTQRLKIRTGESFASYNAALDCICARLSRTFLELKSVVLKPYFMRWSDNNLRKAVINVANAWEVDGPLGQKFMEASVELLNDVSVDRTAQVHQTLFFRFWNFLGAFQHIGKLVILIVLVAVSGMICVQNVFFPFVFFAEEFFFGVFMILVLIFFSVFSLVLLHHNAVAEKVRDLIRVQMLMHVSEAMHNLSSRENITNNTNIRAKYNSYEDMGCSNFTDDDEHHLYSCNKRGIASSFENVSGKKNSISDSAVLSMCLKNKIDFLKSLRSSVATVTESREQSKNNLNTECAQPIKANSNCLCKSDMYNEKISCEEFCSYSASEANKEQLLFSNRSMGLGNNSQHTIEMPIVKARTHQDDTGFEDDCYNFCLMGRVSFEQQQLYEELRKNTLLQKGLGLNKDDFSHSELQESFLFPTDLNGQSEVVHSTEENSHCCCTVGDSQKHANLDNMALVHCSSCGVNHSERRMSAMSASDTSLFSGRLRKSLSDGTFDTLAITVFVYHRGTPPIEGFLFELWSRNCIVLQRDTLDSLEKVYKAGSERFKAFVLHAPDLNAKELEIALMWLLQGNRAVFFYSSSHGSMPAEIPFSYRLEIPFKAREVETILLAGLGVGKKMYPVDLFRPSKQLKVPRYTLGRRLGGGTSGNVFEVEMELSGARCAVKRIYLRGNYDDGSDGVVRQLREVASEVAIMSSLTHPNIVQYFFCGRDDNCVSIFMELCSGGSLSELIARGELGSAYRIKNILRDIIGAVGYLHGKHIVHCDLKPENVLFRDGIAKVSDFGAAVFRRDVLTNLKGTFAYMAPEVLLEETYGSACDVWSIGCIAAQVLSISLSQHGLGLVELCEKYRQMSPEETLEFDCDNATVRDFLESCLLRDPNLRCSTEDLLKHTMFKEDDAAVHEWLLTCSVRKRALQLSRSGRSYEGIALSTEQLQSPVSSCEKSLRSADLSITNGIMQ